jgi:catechol-2,3-dioxygenase
MKRLHIHIAVEKLEESTKFYAALFGKQPSKLKPDYAKWMLDDPHLNFAISSRTTKTGLDHLGIQVNDEGELSELRERLQKADLSLFDEGETTCCYAKSDKSWVQDPSGIAWEAYRTMVDVELFHNKPNEAEACCAPKLDNGVTTGCC